MFLLAGATNPIESKQWPLLLAGILAAFIGVMVGKRFLHKITMQTIQSIAGIMLLGIAFALMLGLI